VERHATDRKIWGPVGHLGNPHTLPAPLGREPELALLDSFLAEAKPPAALLIEGPAGIGKTTLFEHAIGAAVESGRQLARARPIRAEAEMTYAGLDALLGGFLAQAARDLPQPQRVALEVALLRREAGLRPIEPGAVATATLTLIRALSGRQPVLLAVDDLQWLDQASLSVVRSALNRLGEGDDVLVVAAWRAGSGTPDLGMERSRVTHLEVGPLPLVALRELVLGRLGKRLSLPAARRLERLCGGNPFYALELARANGGGGLSGGGRLALTDLQQLIGDRLAALPSVTLDALGAVAALGQPTHELLIELVEDEAVLDPAFSAGVLELEGAAFGFAHPLLAEAAYAALPPARRRAVHRRLAGLIANPEERARHLAAATVRADAEAAAALLAGAAAATARGAPGSAADLLEAAARLTPRDQAEAAVRRRLEAARRRFSSGDFERGEALCKSLLHELEPGELRAEVLATIAFNGGQIQEDIAFGEQAVAECETAEARARCLLYLASTITTVSHEQARQCALEANELLDEKSDPALRAWAAAELGMVSNWLDPGGDGLDLLRKGAELERRHGVAAPDIYASATTMLGVVLLVRDELDEARRLLTAQHDTAAAEGNVDGMNGIAMHLSELECRAGNLPRALACADEALSVIDTGGQDQPLGAALCARARACAYQGDVELARSLAERGLAVGLGVGDHIFPIQNRFVLGFVDLSLGDHQTALAKFEEVRQALDRDKVQEPETPPVEGDRIECLIALGRLDEAEAAITAWEELGRRLDRPFVLATGARGRGLLAAARGDLEAAVAALDEALAHHQRLPVPHERARTLLARGVVLRRAGQRRAARAALEGALAIFESIGSALWAERARTEAGRLGGRAPAGDELTPTERRVADLVARGKSNREVADTLFVTVRTVEANLTRVYYKLHLRSRAELAARWHDGDTARPG
jgi:DNA-binding CsgD family transcriptional regulator